MPDVEHASVSHVGVKADWAALGRQHAAAALDALRLVQNGTDQSGCGLWRRAASAVVRAPTAGREQRRTGSRTDRGKYSPSLEPEARKLVPIALSHLALPPVHGRSSITSCTASPLNE